MLNVALPKGRLGDRMYDLLARIGYGCTEDYNATRKLVVENPAAGIRYFLVKPSDVAIYVEHGAADVGIVGKDILTEPLPMSTSCWIPALAGAGCAWLPGRLQG